MQPSKQEMRSIFKLVVPNSPARDCAPENCQIETESEKHKKKILA